MLLIFLLLLVFLIDQVGRTSTATTFRPAALAEETNDYDLSDLQFRILRSLKPPEFYQR